MCGEWCARRAAARLRVASRAWAPGAVPPWWTLDSPSSSQRRVAPGVACASPPRWAQGRVVAAVGCRARQGTQQHLCGKDTGSARLNHPVIDLCRNQPWRGGFTRNALARHQTVPSSPFLCLLLILRDGKNKEENRLATFRSPPTLVLQCNKKARK